VSGDLGLAQAAELGHRRYLALLFREAEQRARQGSRVIAIPGDLLGIGRRGGEDLCDLDGDLRATAHARLRSSCVR